MYMRFLNQREQLHGAGPIFSTARSYRT